MAGREVKDGYIYVTAGPGRARPRANEPKRKAGANAVWRER